MSPETHFGAEPKACYLQNPRPTTSTGKNYQQLATMAFPRKYRMIEANLADATELFPVLADIDLALNTGAC